MKKKFSRRHFLGLAGLSAAGLALSGCNSGKKAKVQGGSRTVKDLDGNEIEVPASPQKVVAMSEPTLDNALALGVPLVGATAGRGQSTIPNYLSDKGKDIPILGNVAQPNFEAIGAAKPDLILVDGTSVNNNQPVLDALAKIAPTLAPRPRGCWGGENPAPPRRCPQHGGRSRRPHEGLRQKSQRRHQKTRKIPG